ncbi:putative transcription regulator [Massariosphaeria phaeospora]|uniref:Putative transcription regulator n=1 Tax=Massariosphaeria phaeospora TaxID=100035 RepID=A0A7C8MFR6_9PLEO|nr:putative transcription regulator [Massariosphaeria phaeospora]
MSAPFTITTHLLTQHTPLFARATQAPFLRLAASGQLPKPQISHWLANDRLYMQGYIQLTGSLLHMLQLPQQPTPNHQAPHLHDPVEVRLLDWLVDALVNIRREERFFVDVAERYGLDLDLTEGCGAVNEERKLLGLKRFETLFDSLTTAEQAHAGFLPWLEGVVVFWATEKVYFEAWSWAKRQAETSSTASANVHEDEDGGAMRKEFIPNWTNEEFIRFVDALEAILNEGVRQAVGGDERLMKNVVERAERRWKELLDAEEGFWPEV